MLSILDLRRIAKGRLHYRTLFGRLPRCLVDSWTPSLLPLGNQKEAGQTRRDHLRRDRARRGAWRQGHPGAPTGHVARPLTTLAALLSGIVARQRTQRPTIAPHVPDGNTVASRVKRCARGIDNDPLGEEGYC